MCIYVSASRFRRFRSTLVDKGASLHDYIRGALEKFGVLPVHAVGESYYSKAPVEVEEEI